MDPYLAYDSMHCAQPGMPGIANVLCLVGPVLVGFALASALWVIYRLNNVIWNYNSWERETYTHVPAITAMMVLQNLARCREDFETNLPVLFSRHAGALNIPSSHLMPVYRGCLLAAMLNYDLCLMDKMDKHDAGFHEALRPTQGIVPRPTGWRRPAKGNAGATRRASGP